MRKLIIHPSQISFKKKEYVFLGKWFLNLFNNNLKKNIKIYFLSRKKKINQKVFKKIYKTFLEELYPQLNKIHKINWSLNTWNFFIGPWLHNFIIVGLDRIEMLSKLKNKSISIDHIIKIGKSIDLSTTDYDDFRIKSSSLEWNKNILSRIIFLKKSLNKKIQISNKTKYKKKKYDFFYIAKITLLKIFERFFCINNKYLFYNTYIKNKFKLFKIQIALNNFPFRYSYKFFNEKIVKVNPNQYFRKKINLALGKNNETLQILKILFIETLPTVYLEGFDEQKKLSETSHLPKKINKIYTASAYADNSFKFWLANQINKSSKVYYGQHGPGYMYKNLFTYQYEIQTSYKRFTWGKRLLKNKEINVGNFLLNFNNFKKIPKKFNNKKFLIVLPRVDIFNSGSLNWYENKFNDEIESLQYIVNKVDYKNLNRLDLKDHPKNKSREIKFQNFISLKENNSFISPNANFDKISNNYSLLIFSYLSTEFLNQMASDKPSMLFLKKNLFEQFFTAESKADFKKLSDAGIFFTNTKNLVSKINETTNNLKKWWEDKKNKKIRKDFSLKYADPNFKIEVFIKNISN